MTAFEIWPGPMEGIFSADFIRAADRLDLTERWMTPFLRISQFLPGRAKLRAFLAPYLASERPVTVQLMGSSPELVGECAARMMELGAAGINLNCGCPSGRVVSGGVGGGALKHPEAIPDFCVKIKEFLPHAELSVKLRAGFDCPETMETLLPALAQCNAVSKLFFHHRTVRELYRPVPERDQRFAEAVKLAAPLPVILNGDVTSVAEAHRLATQFGCAGVMIGRGWLRDPYLLRRFHGDETPEETGRERFFAELCRHPLPCGAKLELIRMLWGSDHPRFQAAIAEKA